jgi:hypothetical protein
MNTINFETGLAFQFFLTSAPMSTLNRKAAGDWARALIIVSVACAGFIDGVR